jgi:hypothetical protein
MKLGFMVMTLKQNVNHLNGSRPVLQHHRKARQVKSNVKVILITFFNSHGIVHHRWVPQDQTANQHFYLELMRCKHQSASKNWPEA